MYFIGIDGGGTKTSFKLFNPEGKCLISAVRPTCHILQVAPSQACIILKSGIDELLPKLPKGKALIISAGLAGYGEDQKIRTLIEEVCREAFSPYKYYIHNDVSIALEGALAGEDGILAIAGTGSIALAKQDGQYLRCGGWGYLLGDEGSAYWIAKELFRHYTHQIDGRENQTQLVRVMKDYAGLKSDYDLIFYVSKELGNDRSKIANHARLLNDLIQINDPIGSVILEEAGAALSQMINALARHYTEPVSASYYGGVFNLGEHLLGTIRPSLLPHVRLVESRLSPEEGAVILAKNLWEKEQSQC